MQTPYSITNAEGIKLENISDIPEEYTKYYKTLLNMFFADSVKCFDKLWLKVCLLEMNNLGYDPNTLKILYEMSKETDIIIRTPVGNTENIQVE